MTWLYVKYEFSLLSASLLLERCTMLCPSFFFVLSPKNRTAGGKGLNSTWMGVLDDR